MAPTQPHARCRSGSPPFPCAMVCSSAAACRSEYSAPSSLTSSSAASVRLIFSTRQRDLSDV